MGVEFVSLYIILRHGHHWTDLTAKTHSADYLDNKTITNIIASFPVRNLNEMNECVWAVEWCCAILACKKWNLSRHVSPV